MNRTNIPWALNPDGTRGFSSNPVRGECPIGCSYCYVKPFRKRFGWHNDIRFYPQELEAIRKRKKPAGIFLGSTIELFHDETIKYMPTIMDTIKACPHLRFYLLTKQPQNLIRWSPFPPNCWVGVTTVNANKLTEAWRWLSTIEAKVKYISIEPFQHWDMSVDDMEWTLRTGGINWVIIGAQTKPYKPPKIEWVKEIVKAADKANAKVFIKNNITAIAKNIALYLDMKVGDIGWDNIRQEMPDA